MMVEITTDCIACERCVDICPEVFEMGEGIAQVKTDPVDSENEAAVREAADECPTTAILITE